MCDPELAGAWSRADLGVLLCGGNPATQLGITTTPPVDRGQREMPARSAGVPTTFRRI
jgi:hypothetical protein